VDRTAVLRNLINTGGRIAALGFDESRELEDILADADRQLGQVVDRRALKASAPLQEVVDSYYAYLERLQDGGAAVAGLSTGLIDLDAMTGGLQRSDLIILAARPGVGKSALALSIARNIAERGDAVGYVSLEMNRDLLIQRLAAQETGIDALRLRTGKLTQAELVALFDALGRLASLPIYVDDTSGITMSELRSRARRMAIEQGIQLLVVDYLQLVNGSTGKRSENRTQEVGNVSRGLKQIARELDIPVIAISSLSRAVESRSNRRPELSDLRESGDIESDADIVAFLYREELYDQDTDQKGMAELIIKKHRSGPLGTVTLFFDARTTRFRDLAPYMATA
jgi:replicative DNA helicase